MDEKKLLKALHLIRTPLVEPLALRGQQLFSLMKGVEVGNSEMVPLIVFYNYTCW